MRSSPFSLTFKTVCGARHQPNKVAGRAAGEEKSRVLRVDQAFFALDDCHYGRRRLHRRRGRREMGNILHIAVFFENIFPIVEVEEDME